MAELRGRNYCSSQVGPTSRLSSGTAEGGATVTATEWAADRSESRPLRRQEVLDWVAEVAELTATDRMVWCDGSPEDWTRLTDELVKADNFTRVDPLEEKIASLGPWDKARAVVAMCLHVAGTLDRPLPIDVSPVIADEVWKLFEPLLPDPTPRRGGRWREHRDVLEGVAWRYRTAAPWREMPEQYGPWQSVYDRHTRWARDGTYERLLAAAPAYVVMSGAMDWLIAAFVDRRRRGAPRRPPLTEDLDRRIARSPRWLVHQPTTT